MCKFKYSIIVLIFSILSATAQNYTDAERVMSDLISTIKTNAVRTNFTLVVSGKNNVNSQSNSGTFTLKANKFVVVMDEMKVWFDGKTQWAWVSQSNEVSITEPSETELAELNPLAILSAFKMKSKIGFSKTKSNLNYAIELIPKVKNVEINKVEVQINKSTGNLISIKMNLKNGSSTLLTLKDFQKGIHVTDVDFIFNKAKYKGVTINDLR